MIITVVFIVAILVGLPLAFYFLGKHEEAQYRQQKAILQQVDLPPKAVFSFRRGYVVFSILLLGITIVPVPFIILAKAIDSNEVTVLTVLITVCTVPALLLTLHRIRQLFSRNPAIILTPEGITYMGVTVAWNEIADVRLIAGKGQSLLFKMQNRRISGIWLVPTRSIAINTIIIKDSTELIALSKRLFENATHRNSDICLEP